jgi:hypothetical protein
MAIEFDTEYVTVAIENDHMGGMPILHIVPRSMTEVDWYNVRNLLNIYAWTEPLSALTHRVRHYMGSKATVLPDENVVYYGEEESNEMYMDYCGDANITFHRIYMA